MISTVRRRLARGTTAAAALSTGLDESHDDERAAHPWRALALEGGAVGVAALAVLSVVLRLWKASVSVPWSYSGDTNFHAMVVQTALERGWFFTTPRLGAPIGHELYDFPLGGETFQVLVMKMLGLVLDSPFAVINVYYALTFVLVALSAYVVLRLLGIARLTSGLFALLFAFLPYHFSAHGQGHLFLSGYYSVPIAALLLCWHLEGRLPPRAAHAEAPLTLPPVKRLWAVVALAALVGSTSTYYAIFTLTLLSLVTLVEVLRSQSWRPLASAAVIGGTILLTLVAGLLPTLLYQRSHGVNPDVARRTADHTEMLGLHLTALLVPRDDHRLAPLAELGQRSRQVPLPSERGQTLGIVGAVGLVTLVGAGLGHVLRPSPAESPFRRRLATLTLLALLIGTVGGLSFLFALLGLEEVRAWNRLTVFIAFFAMAGLASHLDQLGLRWRSRPSPTRPALAAGLAALLVLGVLDQTSNSDVPDYNTIRNDFSSDRSFVARLESRLPPRSMVFQLPYVPFPEAGSTADAVDYDLLAGYLHSERLRWSYGAMRSRAADWQVQWVSEPLDRMVAGLSAIGFAGIYVDRFALPDRGTALERDLARIIGTSPLASRNGRLAFFDLRAFGARFRAQHDRAEVRALKEAILHPPTITWPEGFTSVEGDGRERWRRAAGRARLELDNTTVARSMTLRFRAQPLGAVPALLRVSGAGADTTVTVPPEGREVSVRLRVPEGRHSVTFTTEPERPPLPGEASDANLRVIDLRVVDPVVDRVLAGMGAQVSAR